MIRKENTVVNERTITVKGIGNVKKTPDMVVITMSLTTTTPDYTKTNELSALELEGLKKALISAGHEKQTVKTTAFNIRTEQERYQDATGNWLNKFKGYSCTHDLKLEFDLDMELLGETLMLISKSGANPQLKVAFSVKDKNAVQAELLEKAVTAYCADQWPLMRYRAATQRF